MVSSSLLASEWLYLTAPGRTLAFARSVLSADQACAARSFMRQSKTVEIVRVESLTVVRIMLNHERAGCQSWR